MVRLMCNMTLKDIISSDELRAHLGLYPLDSMYKTISYSGLGMLNGWMMAVGLGTVEILL